MLSIRARIVKVAYAMYVRYTIFVDQNEEEDTITADVFMPCVAEA